MRRREGSSVITGVKKCVQYCKEALAYEGQQEVLAGGVGAGFAGLGWR
ncbi:MAG: hypothetical protein IPJ98_20280 [Bryobacterales bacterium]|nr:hypothetical protein [Bryobacterales bacterium]